MDAANNRRGVAKSREEGGKVSEDSFRIVEYRAENFQRLKLVEFSPDADGVVISGKNAQGKSAIIASVEAMLLGKRAAPERPVREGEEIALGRLDLGDYKVEGKWSSDGKYQLVVRGKDGHKIGAPQDFLDSIYGDEAVDPSLFLRMSKREQLNLLMSVSEISEDLGELETERSRIYDERRDIGRDLKKAEGALASLSSIPEDIGPKKDTKEALEKLQEASTIIASIQSSKQRLGIMDEEIASMRARLEAAEKEKVALVKRINETVVPVMEEVKVRVTEADAHNRKVEERDRKIVEKDRAQKQVENLLTQVSRFTFDIEKIDARKALALKEAKFPLEGLSFDGEGILYKNQPFEQSSQAEKITVSMAIATARNPRLKWIPLRAGNDLDEESLGAVMRICREKGYQPWIEKIDPNQPGCLIIEEGELVGFGGKDGGIGELSIKRAKKEEKSDECPF